VKINRKKFLALFGISTASVILKKSADNPIFAYSDDHEEVNPNTKRYGMVIDIKRCLEEKNCTACIDACHLTHNVPDICDSEEEIKWIWKEKFKHAFPKVEHEHLNKNLLKSPVIVMCNHCDNPPCVRVCPTQSTWRRNDGVIMMDMHRCIGCRYCMSACPYGSRSFNWKDPKPYISKVNRQYPTRTRGVVEKCNFCAERLAKGLKPACVEACKKEALTFGNLNNPKSKIKKVINQNFTIRRKTSLGTKPEVYYIV
jgi:molybdopterin-containing oxidoreductase family iron-sulfur binding subunit